MLHPTTPPPMMTTLADRGVATAQIARATRVPSSSAS